MKTTKQIIIIIKESVIGSIIKDIFTFIMFAGLMYFNHKVLSGHVLVDVLFIIFVLLWLQGMKSSQVFNGSKKDAIEWLNDEE